MLGMAQSTGLNCPLESGGGPCECNLPRCPDCGYAEHDARFQGDHDRCCGEIPAAVLPPTPAELDSLDLSLHADTGRVESEGEPRQAPIYRGLLSPEEARACVEAGYRGPWVNYWPDGPNGHITFRYDADEALLFAPPPGYLLPMATAPRDGRHILLHHEPGPWGTLEAHYCDGWVTTHAEDYPVVGDVPGTLIGWFPIVTRKTP